MKVKDSPAKDQMPPVQLNKTLNARLKSGNLEISASDWLRLDQTPIRGNTVCLYLSGGTFQELKALFEKLSEEAEVTDPLKEMFFGVYGALNDKFGVRWMFTAAKKRRVERKRAKIERSQGNEIHSDDAHPESRL
jgi:PhnB protein